MSDKELRILRATRRKIIRRIVFVLIIAIVLGGLAWWLTAYISKQSKELPGVFYSEVGRTHITVGKAGSGYNSNPPTSGDHYPGPAEWGSYREESPDEILIHNLEHGGIWISYRPGVPDEVRDRLEGFYKKWGRKIIVTPRSKNDADIAVAAWTHLDKFSVAELSEERVEKFIRAYRNKGPEFVP